MENLQKIKINTKSPGKTLLSGGYLILNKSKRGLVINTDTYISCESFIESKINKSQDNYLLYNITSEYLNETFNYKIYIANDLNSNLRELKIIEANNKNNKWIQNCIISSLFFYLSKFDNMSSNLIFNQKNQIEINTVIKSDFRFYSYSKDSNSKSIKTGLGSSSALITSLTTNMILVYDYISKNEKLKENICVKDIGDKNIQAIILGSCLLSNNLSQNKIGSCFDIISCLFGSQVFIQSQKNIFISSPYYFNSENKKQISDMVVYLKEEYIPKILFLSKDNHFLKNNFSFISIEMGSDTRIFVKKVLEYANSKKKEQLYDDELFSELNNINEQIINLFINDVNNNELLKELCKKYRGVIRKISKESNVDIEPEILIPLLDKLINNPKIIYSICPGAGGYDSIVLMGNDCINKDELTMEVIKIINEFNEENKNKKIDIKASILEVNISKDLGTLLY